MPKNFRKIPSTIKTQLRRLGNQNIVVGCSKTYSADEIASGKLNRLGVELSAKGLTFPSSIIPPGTGGKYSDRNINGYEVIRKDLPKETHYNSFESPDYGDWSKGSHTVNMPYEKYPRDDYAPQLAEIRISSPSTKPEQPKYILVFQVDRVLDPKSPSFESNLLESINLLQENVGAIGLQKSGATIADYLKSVMVSWEILPPGTKEETIARVLGKKVASPEERSAVEERYDFLMGFKPKSLVYGFSGIQRYFGALIENNLIVFENIEYGNAIYIMFEDWKELSKHSRTELLSGRYGKKFERVTHATGWKESVKAIIKQQKERPA